LSSIYLIRHGQAGPRNRYDTLSELGCTQARLLGEYFVSQKMTFQAMVAGALARQQRTAAAVRRAYLDAGAPAPEIVTDPGWNEFDLEAVYGELAPLLSEADPQFRAEYEEMLRRMAAADDPIHRDWSRCDLLVFQAWVEERLPCRSEPWADFRERVAGRLERLAGFGGGQAVAVFTSATPIGVWLGMALGTDTARMMRLAGAIYNTGVTSLRIRGDELSLFSFNGTPHLSDPAMRTFR
jgi:broad specificity phosphatase PhoE